MNTTTCRRLTRRLHARAPFRMAGVHVTFDFDKGYRVTMAGWAPVTLGHTSRDATKTIDRMGGWFSFNPGATA